MTILILVGMAVLVGVCYYMYLNLVEVDACCLKQEMPGKHYAVPKNCFVLLCKMSMLLFF